MWRDWSLRHHRVAEKPGFFRHEGNLYIYGRTIHEIQAKGIQLWVWVSVDPCEDDGLVLEVWVSWAAACLPHACSPAPVLAAVWALTFRCQWGVQRYLAVSRRLCNTWTLPHSYLHECKIGVTIKYIYGKNTRDRELSEVWMSQYQSVYLRSPCSCLREQVPGWPCWACGGAGRGTLAGTGGCVGMSAVPESIKWAFALQVSSAALDKPAQNIFFFPVSMMWIS